MQLRGQNNDFEILRSKTTRTASLVPEQVRGIPFSLC